MKIIRDTVRYIIVLLAISSCTKNPFKGELTIFQPAEEIIEISPVTFDFKESHIPFFAVCDTFAIFYNNMIEGHSFSVFNLNDGNLLGKFFPCGHGHDEYLTVSPVFQIFKEDGHQKTLLTAPNEDYVMIWDITESLAVGKTVCERVSKYEYDKGCPISISRCEYIGTDKVLTYRGGYHNPQTGQIAVPIWQMWSFDGGKHLADIRLFQAIKNENPHVMPETFYSGMATVKKDRTKFAEAMLYLPQINIVDVESGKARGFLMEDYDDYAIFSTDMSGASYYYRDIQSSDDYIYALWCGKRISEYNMEEGMDEIHVFDWNGTMIRRMKLSEPVQKLFYDDMCRSLYGCDAEGSKLYKYEV